MNKDLLKEKYASITLKNALGLRTDVNDNINYFSMDKCAYLSGNYVVICTIKEKTQYFIPANPKFGEITCFAIDERGDHILLAIAQIAEKNQITIKIINKNDIGNEHVIKEFRLCPDDIEPGDYFISLSVNMSKFHILALFGPKVTGVVQWYYDSKTSQVKIISGERLTSKFNYKQVKFNPYDPSFFAACGEGAFSVFRYNDTDKKLNRNEITQSSYPEFEKCIFNLETFTWVSPTRIAVINYSCDILVIDYYKKFDTPVKKLIKASDLFDTKSRAKSIFSRFNNIFIVKDDGYTLRLETKNTESKQISYDKVPGPKIIPKLKKMEVHTVSVNNPIGIIGNYGGVLFTTESGQIYHVDISNENNLYDGSNFKEFIADFHSEEIVAVDCSKLKTLIVTAGKDRWIKIWNFMTLQLEAKYQTQEDEPTHISFHPNGLHIGVLFRSKCKLMNICEKEIKPFKDIIIDMPFDIKFSLYGNYFAICYSTKFAIYDFYTYDLKFRVLENTHKNEVTSFCWDNGNGISDFHFATCGNDGKAYYWDINNHEHPIYEYINRDKTFQGVNFYKTYVDGGGTSQENLYFLLIDNSCLYEVQGFQIVKDGGKIIYSKDGKSSQNTLRIILREDYINRFYYDHETKVVITSNGREHCPTIRIFKYGGNDTNEMSILHQANSTGVNDFKVSNDLSYLFSVGKDKCLLVFQINNITKQDKREESPEADLILIEKSELDSEKENLMKKSALIRSDINREEEKGTKEQRELNEEIVNNQNLLEAEENTSNNRIAVIEEKITEKEMSYQKEEKETLDAYQEKLEILVKEQEISKQIKLNEEKKESENIERTIKNHNAQEISQLKLYKNERKKKEQEYLEQIMAINMIIVEKESQKQELINELTKEKEELMKLNDNDILVKTYELEKLKIEYNRVEDEFNNLQEQMNREILAKKKEVKNKEESKNTAKNELTENQNTNDKLFKDIREYSAERRDKEQTIVEKNMIERELFKENQELEKFKFVLNYKIKELQHKKDPKENKLQQLEKQAKDMDREIKNFEFAQRNYLIELTTNNEIMNLHEKQILDCEKEIDKLKNYKKLFKHALYLASTKAGSYKQLKRRIVELKKWFLDKEYITQLEKTSDDSDYETKREFLEENIKNNKDKIRTTQKLFSQDYQKLMRDEKNLIRTLNILEREQHEINLKDFSKSENSGLSLKGKSKSKVSIPESNSGAFSLNRKEKELRNELHETEKKIVMINLKKKKMMEEKEKEEDKLRKKVYKRD